MRSFFTTAVSRHFELLVPVAGDQFAGPAESAWISLTRLRVERPIIRWSGVLAERKVEHRLTAVVSMHRSGRPRAQGRRSPDGNAEQPFRACEDHPCPHQIWTMN